MVNLPHANNFRDLLVYQKARQLSLEIFNISQAFPKDETYSLTNQIRRSSRSIGAQIAEAWATRRYNKYFVSKLTVADGEQHETQHWIEVASDCGYISQDVAEFLQQACKQIGKLLNGMMEKSSLFCVGLSKGVHEDSIEYIVEPADISS